uniref:F-box protein AT5G49610-like beta-propeller domain-containing protein n=1 Tax=Arundo donax TaxID=35708 RepID=A0A0A8YJB8_ARUDO
MLFWLHDMDGNGNTGNWVLTDTICLLEAFGRLQSGSVGSRRG